MKYKSMKSPQSALSAVNRMMESLNGVTSLQRALNVATMPSFQSIVDLNNSPAIRLAREGAFGLDNSTRTAITEATKSIANLHSSNAEVLKHIHQINSATSQIGELRRASSMAIGAMPSIYSSIVEQNQNRLKALSPFLEQSTRARELALSFSSLTRNTNPIFRDFQRQQKKLAGTASAISRILDHCKTHSEVAISMRNIGAAGSLAASLAASGINPATVSPLADLAQILVSARGAVENSQLWNEAAEGSLFVESITAFSATETQELSENDTVLIKLEELAEHIKDAISQKKSSSWLLHSLEIASFVLAVASFILSVLPYYIDTSENSSDLNTHSSSSEITERLEQNIIAPLEKAMEKSNLHTAGMEFVVCKVQTRAFVRQAPNRKSDALGWMMSGQKAAIVSETKGWIEVEFVDATSGKQIRGWVYGRLLAKLKFPE